MKGYIYKISSPLIKDFYIGSTTRFNKRKYEHNKKFKAGTHSARPLQEQVNRFDTVQILQYDIILEIEISDRNELFTYEQQIVDEAIKNQEPICNANTNIIIIKNMSTERTFKTYEQYREARIVYEIDTFYYHIAKHFDIHKDTLNKALSLQTTYLEFKEKYERENLTWEQKVEEYMNVAPKYIPHTKNTSGVMTYNYLQVLCFYKLMYRIDEFSQILNLTQQDYIECY